jgi:hypothetical protein
VSIHAGGGGEKEKGDGVIGIYHDICTIHIPATALQHALQQL